MAVLENLGNEKVYGYFEEICNIPHGSGNLEDISDYLVTFAKEHNLKYRQDEKLNVVIWKDAAKGYEDASPVIIQGHMDMVAVKENGCGKDMEKEGLDLEIVYDEDLESDVICAKGTSLGGDDGIAVAYALALLDSDDIPYPALEVVITVDEEVGMLGATAFDASDLKAKTMLNIDSEDEGIFTVSCAGGATVKCDIPYKRELVNAQVMEIRLDGFLGGHSGCEIDKDRANANEIMGRVLLNLIQAMEVRVITISGGEKDNVIANLSEMAVAILPENIERAQQIVNDTIEEVCGEYKMTDPGIKATLNVMGVETLDVMTFAATVKIMEALVNMPSGVQRMSHEVEGLVQTSVNLGMMRTNENAISLTFSVRSSKATEKNYIIEKIRSLAQFLGTDIEVNGNYPEWEYKADSKLRETMVSAYRELYGSEPVVEGIHAGLECGIFASKIKELDCVSFGPQMRDIHTTKEVLSVESVNRTWNLLLKTLEKMK